MFSRYDKAFAAPLGALIGLLLPAVGVPVDPEIAGGIAVVLSSLLTFFVPNRT